MIEYQLLRLNQYSTIMIYDFITIQDYSQISLIYQSKLLS